MSPEPTSGRDELSGEADEPAAKPRVLLFMNSGRNRELLADTLGRRYRVETTTDLATLQTNFDCCVFDFEQFNRVAGTIQSRRETSNPVFLPFVLLVGEDATSETAVEAREYVDDVIELPVKKRALLSRIGNLVERRRTAADLARRETQLERTIEDLQLKERAMDSAPVGISLTDPDREDNPLIYVNDQFQSITGYVDILGENCRLLQGEATDPETIDEVRAAIDAERPVSVDILNYRKNGQKFWNKLDIAPIRDGSGDVSHFVGFQQEITERKIRERRLEVLNRVLSHNLRNKMNVIEGHVELLRDEYDGEEAPSSLSAIEETATDLLSLADSIREIDRALSGPSTTGPIELTERLEQLVGAFEDRFPGATFELSVPEDDPCRVDVHGFLAAIEEAIENAVKHNDTDDPAVELRLERESDGWVTVVVCDNGPGIPAQELHVLREGETTLSHADRLGLWFIYWVVNRIGGTFAVTDVEPRGIELALSVPAGREEPE